MKLPRLREWRELRGMTQVELSTEAGRSSRSIAGYEAGADARPNTARKLAQALEVEVIDLVRRSDQEQSRWELAVSRARGLQGTAKDKLRQEISCWHSAKEEEDEQESRERLQNIGRVLQEAYDAETELIFATDDDMFDADKFPEIQSASHFYGELVGLIEGAGLRVEKSSAPAAEKNTEAHHILAV